MIEGFKTGFMGFGGLGFRVFCIRSPCKAAAFDNVKAS